MRQLDKSNKNYGDKHAVLIARDIKNIYYPTIIDLSHNNIGNEGAGVLANALKQVYVNVTINLSYNHIGETGYQYFVNIIKEISSFPCLTVNLTNNEIDGSDHIITNCITTNSFSTILNDSVAICLSHSMAKLFQQNIDNYKPLKVSDTLKTMENNENTFDVCVEVTGKDHLYCGMVMLQGSNYCGMLNVTEAKFLQYNYFTTHAVAQIIDSISDATFRGFKSLFNNIPISSDDLSWLGATAVSVVAAISIVGLATVYRCCAEVQGEPGESGYY